jgi:REP element-mobilizing transposase RayT
MAYLDRGYGACPLQRPDAAECIAGTLRHFDGVRYTLGSFVVMSNHVHLLICLIGTTLLEEQCRSWKKFSARSLNRLLGTRGRFWQEESFDHLVRSPEQFDHFRRYIAENPVKAKLPQGSFLHWARPM